MSSQRRAMLLAVVFAAAWATVETVGGLFLTRISPYQVVFMRYATHLTLMFLVWGWRRPLALSRTRRPVYQIARSLLMLGMPASFVMGLQHGLDLRTEMGIFWLAPLFIIALGTLVLGERVRWPIWLAAAGASVGAIFLVGFGPPPPLRALLFPLGMSGTFSLYVVMTRALRTESTTANLFYSALFVALSLVPVMPRVWLAPTLVETLAMVTIGVVGFATLYALDRMASAAPVGPSAPFICFQPLVTTVFGLGLGAHAGRRALAGAALLLLVGGYLFMRELPPAAERVPA